MRETRDLGVTLMGATLLLFAVGYLAQCTPTMQRNVPPAAAEPAGAAASGAEKEREKAAVKGEPDGKSRSREDNEESERVKSIGHALQTIGANPEMRKTYGFPP
jgi:hypothetical protein